MQHDIPMTGAAFPPLLAELLEALLGDAPIGADLLARMRDPAVIGARAQAEAAQRERDWADLGRYQAHNAQTAAAPLRPGVIFMGDSISEIWAVADAGLFSSGRLCRGIASQTSAQMLLRFQPDVLALRPRAVHLLAGTNDIAGNTGPTTPYRYLCNMLAMIRLAQSQGVRVLLGLLPPAAAMSWRPGFEPAPWIAELNGRLRALAAEHNLDLIDYHAPLDDGSGALRADCSNDGVHPNRRGYAHMRLALEPLLQRLAL
jgi:lysophospholipase L1-like esterase